MTVISGHFGRKYHINSILLCINKTTILPVYYLCDMIKLINSVLSLLFSIPVLFYRYSISPFLRPSCRHVPTCSTYMLDALKIHGPFIGLMLGTGRIFRCRPGGTHGYDPVPLYRFKRYNPLGSLFSRLPKENRLKR